MNGRFDPVLGELFNFDEATVAANRAGHLSPRQQQGFAVGAGATRRNSRVVLIILASAFVVAMVVIALQAEGDSAKIAMGAGATLVGVGVVTLMVRRNDRQADRFEQPVAVLMVEGVVVIDEHPTSWSDGPHTDTGWKVTVGEMSFRLLDEWAAPLERGAVYRFYYCDFGRPAPSLLSMERC